MGQDAKNQHCPWGKQARSSWRGLSTCHPCCSVKGVARKDFWVRRTNSCSCITNSSQKGPEGRLKKVSIGLWQMTSCPGTQRLIIFWKEAVPLTLMRLNSSVSRRKNYVSQRRKKWFNLPWGLNPMPSHTQTYSPALWKFYPQNYPLTSPVSINTFPSPCQKEGSCKFSLSRFWPRHSSSLSNSTSV